MNQNKEIAQTILSQLGGNRFALMTGAKNFGFITNGLRFDLPRGSKNKASRVTILLDIGTDTYTMKFEKVNTRKLCVDLIKEVDLVYNDMLQEVFTNNTGLYTSL
jgi:hypothetical protein